MSRARGAGGRVALPLLLFATGCAGTPAGGGGEPLADLRALATRAAPDGDPRTVDLLVAPDGAYLERLGADAVPSLERAVAALDRVLGPEVGLRFRIGGATVFPSTPGIRDDRRLLWEARLRVPRGGCDAVAAFTGQRCGDRAGAALPRLRLLLCADAGDPERNLVHEAAHLFGALDYGRGHPGYRVPSVMSYDSDLPRTLALDPVNLARVRARAGTLPAVAPDPVLAALAARASRPGSGPAAEAREGALLAAESRYSHGEGLPAAERFLREAPEDPVAAWAYGECRRVLKDRDDSAALFLRALRGITGKEAPDGLDRHAALEMARLAVDGVDGTAALREEAEAALAAVDRAFPRDPEVLDLRGSLRARAGDREAAESLYGAALDADPAAGYAWRHLAALGRSAGDPGLWLRGWRGALEADPLDPLLGIRWVAEGLDAFPATTRSPPVRPASEAALAAAARAWPAWRDPERLRARLDE